MQKGSWLVAYFEIHESVAFVEKWPHILCGKSSHVCVYVYACTCVYRHYILMHTNVSYSSVYMHYILIYTNVSYSSVISDES
jgi:hypothetical protein